MDVVTLARWQFGITTVYHFLMVPLTIGLSLVVAWFQTRWHRTGDEAYLRLTRFFGKLFLINFAMGVVTGIVQEFQFGMAWASYSRFVGDVFGAPLAMEALVAFFLESTFLGLWVFGWDRLPPRVHLATIWAAAIGTVLSAYFIVAANSWMQHPVGVRFDRATGRAELTDIGAVLTNPTTLAAYPHVIAGAILTAAVFVGGISAWLLARDEGVPEDDRGALRRAVRGSIALTFVAGLAVGVSGHFQTRLMFEQQPMKMAAAEALCDTEVGPGLSVFAVGDVSAECDVRSAVVPKALSLLATDTTDAEISGVRDLNVEYAERYGEGDYRPNLIVAYWGFRAMILFGAIAAVGAAVAWWLTRGGRDLPRRRWVRRTSLAVIATPFLANAAGWIFTEMGRQPWVVAPNLDGIPEVRLLTAEAVSSSVSGWMVLTTLVGFTLVYAALMVVEVVLLRRYVRAGLAGTDAPVPGAGDEDEDDGDEPPTTDDEADRVLAFAY
ncbi:cytochrome ubiquinol oxidase subunit I [Iamia majanohamensis]|uniref:Cytochrome ubiquinol oxidase subunit I n=1 Tax=Iamia majanohamensis TaxID=467976 RepID=A0AAF0BV91_9ACTN|nr:cytochrome ubiquinol oxidase subunit I [Iamia majanohamensis]WCO66550.1 cytochrome ubiquinol oxidase subunit I [Iamia majanohamensis]